MATTDDIDSQAAVTKFLESSAVVDKEDPTSNSADEVQTILESVALAFLLYPQAALSFVLQANNVLQQVATADLSILTYILKAIGEVDNPDQPITDTSDLTEAQTALVEVDRLGRVSSDVQAYGRYTQAVNRFLDNKLSKTLKRRRTGELERTGPEAKQDLFRILSAFGPVHGVLISRMGLLLNSVSDFQSVSLTKIVATTTVARVRASIDKVIAGVVSNQLSKTATAVELLAGAAALTSISNSRQVYDPTVATGTYPAGRTIEVSSNSISATATGTGTPTSLGAISTPWSFDVTTDPLLSGPAYSVTLPVTGASGRAWVASAVGSAVYDLSSSNTVYVEFDGITPPANEPVMVRTVVLPTGSAVTLAAILTALNNVSTGLINGTAVEIPNTGRILIYGDGSTTRIVIRNHIAGTFDVGGNFIPADPSAHDVLGFTANQTSGDPNVFTSADLVSLVASRVPTATFSVVNGVPTIASNSTNIRSSLSFTGAVAAAFGFSGAYSAQPSYLELIEDGDAVDPASLGVYVGSVVSAPDYDGTNNIFAPVAKISGTQLLFVNGVLIPRVVQGNVKVVSPLVFAVQQLLNALTSYTGVFDNDTQTLQRVLSPVLSKPTQAQTADAKKTIQAVQTKVTNLLSLLSGTVIDPAQTEFSAISTQISASLEERGIDRGLDLLQAGQFSAFFALTSEDASKGTRFLKASEQVGRNELATTTAEQNLPDVDPKGTTPDSNLLPGQNLLEDEEPQ